MLSQEDKQWLLKLARRSMHIYPDTLTEKDIAPIPEAAKQKKGVFITIFIAGNLRGCIGTIIGQEPLWQGVLDNAQQAAYADPRFPPLTNEDVDRVTIEISVLSIPAPLLWTSEKALLKQISPEMGVILQQGNKSATFLPQVWKQLPVKEDFLRHLSQKAGLKEDDWKEKTTKYQYYTVTSFKEDET